MSFVLATVLLSGLLQHQANDFDRQSIEQITLEDALSRAVRLDPNYVAALGRINDAEWVRRSAQLVFILPSITMQTSATKFSTEFFNIGTGALASQIVDARVDLNYSLFRGGSRFADLRRASAELEAAGASEVRERFTVALLTESAYYDVLAERELTVVAEERRRRAEEQLDIARARVLAGAAVQTDSLQLLLELTRARVNVLRQRSILRVARPMTATSMGSRISTNTCPRSGPTP